MALPLLQITPEHRDSLFLALGILLLVVIVGGVLILMFRRHVTDKPPEDQSSHGGFLLSDLRRMRDEGHITAEEYERTRDRVVAKVKEKANEPPKSRPNAAGGRDPDTDA